LDNKSLSKLVVQRHPSVLGLNVKDNLEPKLTRLQKRLSLDNKSLIKLVQMVPNVLIYGIVSKITLNQSSHGYKSSYQLDDKSLIKLLKAQPSVFCYNIKDNLEPNAT
jgi:hypothetical protein